MLYFSPESDVSPEKSRVELEPRSSVEGRRRRTAGQSRAVPRRWSKRSEEGRGGLVLRALPLSYAAIGDCRDRIRTCYLVLFRR